MTTEKSEITTSFLRKLPLAENYDDLHSFLDTLESKYQEGHDQPPEDIIELLNKPIDGKSLLYRAVKCSNYKAVERLLHCPFINPNLGNATYTYQIFQPYTSVISPLFLAVKKNDVQLVGLLLQHALIDPNFGQEITYSDYLRHPGIRTITPLFRAIHISIDHGIINALLAHPKTNIFDGNTYTPTEASRFFRYFYVSHLGHKGSTLSPLGHSLLEGNTELAQLLLDKGAGLGDLDLDNAVKTVHIFSALKNGLQLNNKLVPGLKRHLILNESINQAVEQPPITSPEELATFLKRLLPIEFDIQAHINACEFSETQCSLLYKSLLQEYLQNPMQMVNDCDLPPLEDYPKKSESLPAVEHYTQHPDEKGKEKVDENDNNQSLIKMVESLQRRVDQMEEELEPYRAKRKREAEVNKQRQYIKKHPETNDYYRTLVMQLSAIFYTILILKSNIIKSDPGVLTALSGKLSHKDAHLAEAEDACSFIHHASERLSDLHESSHKILESSAHNIKQILEFLTPATDLLPLISSASKIILMMTEAIVRVSDNKKLAAMQAIMVELHNLGFNKVAENIARRMAFAYKEQIMMLKPDGVKLFSEFGALRILILMLNGHINPEADIVDQIVEAVGNYSITINQHKIVFLDSTIDLPNIFPRVKLPVKNAQDKGLDQDALYHKPGRSLRGISGKKTFWSNDVKIRKNQQKEREYPQGFFTEATRVGYKQVSKLEEVPIHNMANDIIRLGPRSRINALTTIGVG